MKMSSKAISIARFLMALSALVAVGCGRGGPERSVVTGKVTYRGEPVENGEIWFLPVKDANLPSWSAKIIKGEYAAFGRGGVPVGTHRVEIRAWRIHGQVDMDLVSGPAKGQAEPTREQYIPPKYNEQSTLEITVASGSGKIVKDFALTN
jgi:hypothetical protein